MAQGRVWSGRRAAELGLVDVVGGFNRAVALAKEAAGIPADQPVRLQEYSRAKVRKKRCLPLVKARLLSNPMSRGCRNVPRPKYEAVVFIFSGLSFRMPPSLVNLTVCLYNLSLMYGYQPLQAWAGHVHTPFSPPQHVLLACPCLLQTSPLALLSGGGASASASPSLLAMGWLLLQAVAGLQPGAAGASAAASSAAGAPALLGAVLQQLSGAGGVAGNMSLVEQQVAGTSGAALGMGGMGSVQAVMPADVSVEGVGSAALLAAAQAQSGGMLGGSSLSSSSGLGLFDC